MRLPALSSPVHALVVGFGSIGARHARVLEGLGCQVSVVSRRTEVHPRCHSTIAGALGARPVDYVVIANETSRHRDSMLELHREGFRGRLLVEKPLWLTAAAPLDTAFESVFVAYQLRHDPLLRRLHSALADQTIVSAEVRAASYLPSWRPGRDYRRTASALIAAGGGALRDLSHELDYVQWLFGPWRRLAAVGGRLGPLEIETDDSWIIIGQSERCPLLSVSLNYLDRTEERWLVINTRGSTLRADLVARTLTIDGQRVWQGSPADYDQAYEDQHRALLAGDPGPTCTLDQGRQVMETIAQVERAAREERWIAA